MTITNFELNLAKEYLQHTDQNILLTGKAGTGKTTFLQNLKKTSSKRMIITAPTGVAAINAGGVTLHSFFQIPFGPFVPGSENYQQSTNRKFNQEKIKIIKSLELLVIDEISMVRADLLDGIDAVLRRYRRNNFAFGGVQLLFIGDLRQLAPVVLNKEKDILKQYYPSYYFFSSIALKQTKIIPIEFKYIYRQSDTQFINLLNRIRENEINNETLKELNSRYIPNFAPSQADNYINLCTHNHNANSLNKLRLQELKTKSFAYQTTIEDNFPEQAYPTSEKLELKKGAQVMFVRNDMSAEKLYYNGKIGQITFLDKKSIIVKCPGEEEIEVEKVTWENIKYTLNQENKKITEEVIGKFTQYPLRLAWAITIHKAQGLTFENVIIDAQEAFAHGQVYVALSRCRTFEGIILNKPISASAIKIDNSVTSYMQHINQNSPSIEMLAQAKIIYQQKLMLECFDFGFLGFNLHKLVKLLHQHQASIPIVDMESINKLEQQTIKHIVNVSQNFKAQLQGLFTNNQPPQDNPYIQERIQKASHYFNQKLQSDLIKWSNSTIFETDNKDVRQKLKQAMEYLNHTLFVKMAALRSCKEQFSVTAYQDSLARAEVDFKETPQLKKNKIDYSYLDIKLKHPLLFEKLKNWRDTKAKEKDIPHFCILHQKVLVQIVIELPVNLPALKKIAGIGPQKAIKLGPDLIKMVVEYCQENKIKPAAISPSTQEKRPLNEPSVDTKQKSYDLFKAGKNITQIAKERSLVTSTIENHLAYFISVGKIDVADLLPPSKVAIITKACAAKGSENLKTIKEELGKDYSYNEIIMVRNFLNFQKDKK